MVGRHRQLMTRESLFPLRRETCTKVIYSPKDLLVWGLKRVLQAGTQQLRDFSGEKETCVCTSSPLLKEVNSSEEAISD